MTMPRLVHVLMVAVALSVLTIPLAGAQDAVTMVFTSTIDTTPLGGQLEVPITVTYSFAPDLSAGSGPSGISATHAGYGPIDMTIDIGGDTLSVSGQGTGITVFNDAGTTFVEDSYDVRVDFPIIGGQQLLGQELVLFRFLLVDSNRDMFTTTELPLTTQFVAAADIVFIDVILLDQFGSQTFLTTGGRPFTLVTQAPPAPRCASSVTTIDELRAGVVALATSQGTKAVLLADLDAAQEAASSGNNTEARVQMRSFIARLVNRSNLEEGRPARIPLAAANNLICAGANVLIGLQLP
jgi:hypothetical protein